MRPLLAAHGVTYDDFSPLYNTQAGAVDLLSDGSAAAAFLGGAVPTASITQVASGRDVLLIPFEREDAGVGPYEKNGRSRVAERPISLNSDLVAFGFPDFQSEFPHVGSHR